MCGWTYFFVSLIRRFCTHNRFCRVQWVVPVYLSSSFSASIICLSVCLSLPRCVCRASILFCVWFCQWVSQCLSVSIYISIFIYLCVRVCLSVFSLFPSVFLLRSLCLAVSLSFPPCRAAWSLAMLLCFKGTKGLFASHLCPRDQPNVTEWLYQYQLITVSFVGYPRCVLFRWIPSWWQVSARYSSSCFLLCTRS